MTSEAQVNKSNEKIKCEDAKDSGKSTDTTSEDIPASIDPTEKWLIRDCEVYKDEYDECTSFKGRFHQYFIYGKSLDCNPWKKDYDNCCKWVDNEDVKAGESVIKSEKERRLKRLRAHYQNDVWKKRDSPPEEWASPLPEWMAKRDENSYLAHVAKEIREGKENDTSSFCVIM